MRNENCGYLETHFYFNDDSHSMDAFVKNKCDKALLSIIDEASKEFGLQNRLTVEVLPSFKGSLKEWLEFVLSPEGAIVTTGVVASVLNLFVAVLSHLQTKTPPLLPESELDIENKRLDIEKKKLEIKLLNKKITDLEKVNKVTEGLVNKDEAQKLKDEIQFLKDVAYDVLINNYKIRKNLSIFYENLIEYHKVEAIGFSTYDCNKQIIFPEKKVERNEFDGFILDLNEYEEIDENAKILIFSPNLVKGKHKWRGYYEKGDKVIEFSMNDKVFKSDVESGAILFKNGSMIKAVLTIKIKLDMSGNESSRSYTVDTVLSKSDGQGYTETRQGKKYKATKKDIEAQITLPFDD